MAWPRSPSATAAPGWRTRPASSPVTAGTTCRTCRTRRRGPRRATNPPTAAGHAGRGAPGDRHRPGLPRRAPRHPLHPHRARRVLRAAPVLLRGLSLAPADRPDGHLHARPVPGLRPRCGPVIHRAPGEPGAVPGRAGEPAVTAIQFAPDELLDLAAAMRPDWPPRDLPGALAAAPNNGRPGRRPFLSTARRLAAPH